MSVQNLNDSTDSVVARFGVPENCFFCLKPLEGLCVIWHDPEYTIGLHPDCADRLAEHLKRDALRAWGNARR